MQYRREIDGLRALAVVPVMLFHAGIKSFGGGFVGVDVFFVISGYLITSIILAELVRDRFSLANFYERRARRILPALFLVMLACIPLAWLSLSPGDMKDFSQSLVALSVFASNFLFWREAGYFDTATELKPLLHTWSLAVEEQFYLVFPLLLMLAWRSARRALLALVAVTGIASLALAQWATVHEPDAAFYLLPTRAWELALGAVAAVHLSQSDDDRIGRALCETASGIGLALILAAVFAYDASTPFPGVYALVPTVGALLIILFGDRQTLVGRLLGNNALVGIGLVSYSAYLWHQPLLAFARHRGVTDFDKPVLLALCLLAVFLAFLTWKFVETPFRNKERVGRAAVFTLAISGSAFFACVGLVGHHRNGDLGQVGEDQKQFLDEFENEAPAWRFFERTRLLETYRNDCNFYDLRRLREGHPTRVPLAAISSSCYQSSRPSEKLVFLWGDSHVQHLNPGLRHVLPGGVDLLQVASSGCAARAIARPDKADYCEYSNWFAFDSIRRLRPKVVVVSQNAGHDATKMSQLASALQEVGVKHVVFIGPSPHWSPTLPGIVATRLWHDVPKRTFSGLDRNVLALDGNLKANFAKRPGVHYISLIDYFCNERGCVVYLGKDFRTGLTSWDYGHLTPVASQAFARGGIL